MKTKKKKQNKQNKQQKISRKKQQQNLLFCFCVTDAFDYNNIDDVAFKTD